MANNHQRRVQYESVDRPPVAKHDSTVLDLAFAMDCTGSMGSYIRQAQQNIRQIVEEIVAKEKSDIHLALIEYRDHPPQDSSFVTRVHDFTSSVQTMKTWLEAASASGGGDGPESVADAWHALLKLNWRAEATKICVHIADAPPHGLGICGDGFPKGCPDGLDPVAIMHQLAEKGVTLYMVGCEPSINQTKPFYMAMAHVTGGQYVPLCNARLLTQVIIGGAEEELSLEALMAEVEEEVRQERAVNGDVLDEAELTSRVHTKMAAKGVKSKQLWRNCSAMPEAPMYAQAMSKHTNMAEMREAMKSVPAPASRSAGVSYGGATKKKSKSRGWFGGFSLFGSSGSESTESERNCVDFVPDGPELLADSAAPAPASGAVESAGMDDSYTVESATLNVQQAQRMVQKAIKRTEAKK